MSVVGSLICGWPVTAWLASRRLTGLGLFASVGALVGIIPALGMSLVAVINGGGAWYAHEGVYLAVGLVCGVASSVAFWLAVMFTPGKQRGQS